MPLNAVARMVVCALSITSIENSLPGPVAVLYSRISDFDSTRTLTVNRPAYASNNCGAAERDLDHGKPTQRAKQHAYCERRGFGCVVGFGFAVAARVRWSGRNCLPVRPCGCGRGRVRRCWAVVRHCFQSLRSTDSLARANSTARSERHYLCDVDR